MINVSLQNFETFLAVAEAGSFTVAAKQLKISKAAVSHAIRLLEQSLQVPLFIRSTRRVSLTDEGELLFAQCQRLKNELDIARLLVGNFKSTPSGKLRISCNPYLAESWLLPILQQYLKKYPKVNVDVLIEERMPDMQREQIDLVFGINWPAPEDIVAKVIGKTRYVLCASPKYFKKFSKPKNLKELEAHFYIPHSSRTAANMIVSLKHKTSLHLFSQLQANNAHFMKQCALLGLGIVQLHEYMVIDELKSGELIEILAEYLQPEIPLYVYYQKHRFVQPKIRALINLMMQDS